MINLDNAKQVFLDYVKNYDDTNDKISLKIEHTLKVMDVAINTARYLNLEDEDIQLAGLIGLLHDIGRFEQVKRYNTFVDRESIDHGDLGVQILEENNFIRKFIQEDCYDGIIKIAIHNHNKKDIQKGLSDKQLLHCKIIRDADKTDIFRVLQHRELKLLDSNTQISEDVLEDFYNSENIKYEKIKNILDKFVCHVSYIFDFNYNYGLNILLQEHYIEKLVNKIENDNNVKIDELDKITKFANEYIKHRLNNKG